MRGYLDCRLGRDRLFANMSKRDITVLDCLLKQIVAEGARIVAADLGGDS